MDGHTVVDAGPAPTDVAPDSDDEGELTYPSAEQLIAQTVALASDDLEMARLAQRYWRFAPDEDLVDRTPAAMLTAPANHVELARQRLPGELKLRVSDGGPGAAPASPRSHTLIEIVVDDMPFLVDSITAALTSHNLDIHLIVHPIVVVRREPLGRLTEVAADVEPDDAIAGDLVESWIRIEVDPVGGPRERERLRSDLRRVLTDVREAVEDWPKMRAAALSIADELASAQLGGPRPPVPEKDITDSVALLRWLAEDHFTFLGYREYRTRRRRRPARRCSAAAWASCAPTRRRRRSCRSCRRRRRPRPWRSGCSSSPRPTPAPPCTAPPTWTTSASRSSTTTATWSASGASSACSPPRRTAAALASCRWSSARSPR